MGISFKTIWKKSKILGEGILILVVVGLMYGFEQLVKEIDEIAGRTEEKVVVQIGKTSYLPKNAEYFRFGSKEEIDELHKSARVVVCHAGVGSIITALEHDKPVIAVPRRKKFGESFDDHQLEIAKELGKEGAIKVIYDVKELERALMNAYDNFSFKVEQKMKLTNSLKKYINELSEN